MTIRRICLRCVRFNSLPLCRTVYRTISRTVCIWFRYIQTLCFFSFPGSIFNTLSSYRFPIQSAGFLSLCLRNGILHYHSAGD